MTKSFSKRYGYHSQAREIIVFEDAPEAFREALIIIAEQEGMRPSTLRATICDVLQKRPDPQNWTEYPNIKTEVFDLINNCEWYKVYDIAENLWSNLRDGTYHRTHQEYPHGSSDKPKHESFEIEVNEAFCEHGIGWRMESGKIVARGSRSFEVSVETTKRHLERDGRPTALNEINQALEDLSRRPKRDKTGAIQHSMAALECVARQICGNERATLGAILKEYKSELEIPAPLDQVIEKIWGYASQFGRHIREGGEPSEYEAELVVHLCSALISYLSAKIKKEEVVKSDTDVSF